MNSLARRNYIDSTTQQVERKKMYKSKKQWIVAGMSLLIASGLGALATSPSAHVSANSHAKTAVKSNHKVNHSRKAVVGNKNALKRMTSLGRKAKTPSASKPSQQTKNYVNSVNQDFHQGIKSVDPSLRGIYKQYYANWGNTPYMWHIKNVKGFDGTWTKTVHFMYNGKEISTGHVTFYKDSHAGDGTKEYVTLPKGYVTADGGSSKASVTNTGYNDHLLASDYDKATGKVVPNGHFHMTPWTDVNVNVKKAAPAQAQEQVKYSYKGQDEGSTTVKGNKNGSAPINGTGIKSGYKLAPNAPKNVKLDGNAKTIPVVPTAPATTNTTVDYMANGKKVGSHQFSGKKNTTFPIGSAPADLPSGYKVNNPKQTIKYDGTTQNVDVSKTTKPAKPAQKTIADKFVFKYKNKNEGSSKSKEYPVNGDVKGVKPMPRPQGMNPGFHLPAKEAYKAYPLDGSTRVLQVVPDRNNIPNVNVLKNNEVGWYHGVEVQRVNTHKHFRWFMINHRGSWIHTNILDVGKKRHYVFYMRPNHKVYHRITRIFKVMYNNKAYIRYEFKIGKMDYFVTGNPDFTKNSYLQPSDLKSTHRHHGHYTIQLTHHAYEYKSKHFSRKAYVRCFKPGKTLAIKRLFFIGRKNDEQTRIQLTNGKYITSNLNWIRLI